MPTFTPEDNIHSLNSVKKSNGVGRYFTNFLVALTVIFLCLGGYFVYSAATTSSSIFEADSDQESCVDWICGVKQNLAKVTKVLSPEAAIKGQERGRTNFLIIGLDSEAGLSDTIMIASLFHKEKKITTVNVPRDFLVNYKTLNPFSNQLENTSFKINEVHLAAQKRGLNGGRELSNFISKEFNLPIDYWVSMNFEAVEKTIDNLGGVDVKVDNSFTDCEFPRKDYSGYLPCQSFKKGVQKMLGPEALIYSRSRHGDNNEGSDFARSKRQSIVIESILQKIKNQNILASVANINGLFSILGENVKTSLNITELKSLISIVRDIDIKKSFSRVVWTVGNGFLCDQTTPEFGYHIFYCDGEIGGSTALISSGRNSARLEVQNILLAGKKEEQGKVSFEIYGNGSKSASKLSQVLGDFGFESILLYNNKSIIPITSGGDIVNIYIPDTNISNQIRLLGLESKLANNTQFNIINSEPLDLPINDPLNPPDVVAWVE